MAIASSRLRRSARLLLRGIRSNVIRRILSGKKGNEGEQALPLALRQGKGAETLALVTLLGFDAETTARMIEDAREKIAHFDRLVFLVSCDDLVAATRTGAVVEQMPGARETVKASPEQCQIYLHLRNDQILSKWQPDYVFQYGLSLQDYIAGLAKTHTDNQYLAF